jgi:hypothetical protein
MTTMTMKVGAGKTVNFHDSKFSLGAIDADTVKATHFGGFDEEEEEGDDDEVR